MSLFTKSLFPVFMTASILIGCNKDSKFDLKSDCMEAGPFKKQVSEITGVVAYDSTEQKYAISAAIPGTYDSVDFGYICSETSFDYKTGDKVVFDGKYYEFTRPKPASFGGLSYYYLDIENIALR